MRYTFSGLMGGSAALWNPSYIRPHSWHDASAADTITDDGGAVSLWADRSANSNDMAQSLAAKKPATGVVGAQINGENAIRFDGTSDEMECLSISVDSYANSIFFVRRRTSLTDSSRLFAMKHATESSGKIESYVYDSEEVIGSRYPVPRMMEWSPIDSDPIIVSYVKDGSTSQGVWENGSVAGTSIVATGRYTTTELYLGAADNYAYAGVDIAEFIVFDKVLSEANRQRVEGYLAWKWGLEDDLPAEHPYKDAAPVLTPPEEVMSFSVAGDLHWGIDGAVDLAAFLGAVDPASDAIILNGDIAADGDDIPSGYEAIVTQVATAGLDANFYYAPGNHDVVGTDSDWTDNFTATPFTIVKDGVTIIVLDGYYDPYEDIPILTEAQRNWLTAELEAAIAPVFVVEHIDLYDLYGFSADDSATRAILASYSSKIAAVVHSHRHDESEAHEIDGNAVLFTGSLTDAWGNLTGYRTFTIYDDYTCRSYHKKIGSGDLSDYSESEW